MAKGASKSAAEELEYQEVSLVNTDELEYVLEAVSRGAWHVRHHERLWVLICRSGWFLTNSGSWSPRCCRRSLLVRRAVGPLRVTSGRYSLPWCTS